MSMKLLYRQSRIEDNYMEMPNLKCVRNEQTEESMKLGVKVKDNFNSK